MDVRGISTSAGARVQQWTCNGGDHQTFNWRGNQLVVRHTNMCVDIINGSTVDGTRVQQWPCSTAANQHLTAR